MKSHRYFYILLFLLCLALFYPARALARNLRNNSTQKSITGQQTNPQQDMPTDQVIIKYKTPAQYTRLSTVDQERQVQRISEAAGVPLTFFRLMSGNAQVYRLAKRLPLEQVSVIAQNLATLPEVEYAEPDAIMQHTLTPNDPLYPNQWDYLAPSAGNYGINAPAAWDITTGSASIVMADIDTGITNHADLSGRTVQGYDFIWDPQVANDGNGRDSDPSDPGDWITQAEHDDPLGYFYTCPVSNSSWHGTHTAGTMGAASNNSLGVAGINWTSKILPVRVLGKCGGYLSDIADGMRWSAGLAVGGVPNNANPAKVENLSLGGSGACGTTYQDAINAITAAGTTVVVAAGNSNTDASNFRPANCTGVITVAATDRNGSRAYYSNYGSSVEISAPGGAQYYYNDPNGILSTLNTGTTVPVADTYVYYQGTSMAAPHVTGVVSLLYSLNPSLTPAQVLQILQNTATSFPVGSTCNTSSCGSGIVNAGAAVANVYGAFSKTTPANGAINVSTSPTLTWGSSNGATSYEYCYDTTNDSACSSWTSTGTNTSVGLSSITPGTTYYWHVRAINTLGTIYSNGSQTAFWSFTTGNAPGAFNKTAPANAANDISLTPTLTWGSSSGASSYEYCYDTTNDNDCSSWTSTGTNTSAGLSGLSLGTAHYWQVRAINAFGTTYANGSPTAYWSFTTGNVPGAFNKNTPTNGASNVSLNPSLTWGSSSGASSYEYCYDTTNDNTCSSWISTGTNASVGLNSLTLGTVYYWHVRAINSFGITYANGSQTAFWSFTTGNVPGAFNKSTPANAANDVSLTPTLTWGSSSGASSYEYCYDTTDDNVCSSWTSTGTNTSVGLSGLFPGITYYWHVRAINAFGTTYSDGSATAFWSFTTIVFYTFLPLIMK